MAVYKQFNTNEVVVSPFKANKRFRFENNQVSSSDVQIEYYQSQQGRYLSGSFDTGFNTIQDGVNIFHSIKQLYYSNYLTSSFGDPMSTASFRSGGTGPQQQNLGQDVIVGNVTGPNFENFLQSSVVQDRKFAQFSASIAPIGFAGTDTQVSRSLTVNWNDTPDDTNIIFNAGQPNLIVLDPPIDDTYVLSTATWDGGLSDSPFLSALAPFFNGATIAPENNNLTVSAGAAPANQTLLSLNSFANTGIGIDAQFTLSWNATHVVSMTISAVGSNYKAGDVITIDADTLNPLISLGLTTFSAGTSTTFIIESTDLDPQNVQTVNASQLLQERINPDVFITPGTSLGRGLTLKPNSDNIFRDATAAGTITLLYLQAPRGPSVISIPSMLYGEAIQPSSFQFEYTSSINFTRSIVEDDGQGNLIVTQSSSPTNPGDPGVPYWSGSIGQIFYSQGIAVITGPDSGSLREFAHNVGYKNNMNPNIISSSIAYSSSITIDENQYKCTVKENEFSYTTNPSALGVSGVLTTKPNQLFTSFNAGNLAGLANNTYAIQPKSLLGTTKASTYYVFKSGNKNSIGQQYRLELVSAGGRSLEFVGYDGNENGTRNALGQVQFNSTGSPAGIAQGFCDAINSVDGFNGEISCSLFQTQVANDSVHLIQSQAGEAGNTRIKYADSFNLLTFQDAQYAPTPARGQEYFGATSLGQGTYNVNGIDTYVGDKGAILNVVVAAGAVTSIEVSQSLASTTTVAETFGGRGYNVGDRIEIAGSDLGGTGAGFINLVEADVNKSENTQVYHDFCTGSLFTPYVTTVGLYNESNDLVCVGKLPRPLPISLYTDTTFMINFDTN